MGEGLRLAERSDAPAERVRVVPARRRQPRPDRSGGSRRRNQPTLTLERQNDGCAAVRSSPLPNGEGARLFEGHPCCTVFPCDAVEVMPLLGS